MPQLSLYLDDSTMDTLRRNAGRAGVSLSRYTATLIQQQSAAWPSSFWDTYGALDDDSFTAPPELDSALDRPRPSFD